MFAPRYQLLKEQAAISMQRLQWHFHVSWNWPTKCNSVWSGSPTRRHDKWRYVLLPFKQSCCQITERTIYFTVCWRMERQRERERKRACVWVQKGFWMTAPSRSCYSGFATFLCVMLKVRKETQISGVWVAAESHLRDICRSFQIFAILLNLMS